MVGAVPTGHASASGVPLRARRMRSAAAMRPSSGVSARRRATLLRSRRSTEPRELSSTGERRAILAAEWTPAACSASSYALRSRSASRERSGNVAGRMRTNRSSSSSCDVSVAGEVSRRPASSWTGRATRAVLFRIASARSANGSAAEGRWVDERSVGGITSGLQVVGPSSWDAGRAAGMAGRVDRAMERDERTGTRAVQWRTH